MEWIALKHNFLQRSKILNWWSSCSYTIVKAQQRPGPTSQSPGESDAVLLLLSSCQGFCESIFWRTENKDQLFAAARERWSKRPQSHRWDGGGSNSPLPWEERRNLRFWTVRPRIWTWSQRGRQHHQESQRLQIRWCWSTLASFPFLRICFFLLLSISSLASW